MKSIHLSYVALAVIVTLSGCSTLHGRNEANYLTTEEAVKRRQEQARSAVMEAEARRLVSQEVSRPYVAGQSIPMTRETKMPAQLRASLPVTALFASTEVDIPTAVRQISTASGILVTATPDALMPPAAFGPKTGVGSTPVLAPPRILLKASGKPLWKLLDEVAAQAQMSWRPTANGAEFFRVETRSYELMTIPQVASTSSTLGRSASGSNAFSSDSKTTFKTENQSQIDGIKAAVEPMLSTGGKFAISAENQTLVVTDTPEIQARVEDFVKRQNKLLQRRVRMLVEAIEVVSKDGSDFGIDWNLVYNTTTSALAASTPTSLTSAQTGAISLSQPIGPLAGSGLVMKALNEVGQVVNRRVFPIITTSGRPVTQALRTTFNYVDQVAQTTVASSTNNVLQAPTVKATHFIHVGHQVGYTRIKKGIEHPTYPAALLIAKASAGTGVYSLTLAEGQGRYWFATVRDGLPAGVDEIVDGLTEPEAVARIRQLKQALEGEVVAVYTDIRQTGIPGQRSLSLHDIFDVVRSDTDRLSKITRSTSTAPKPLIVGTVVAVSLLVGQKGWNYYSDYKRQRTLEANRVVDMTPEEAWAPVVAKFEQTTTDASPSGFLAARTSLSQMPVLWAGWKLAAARCQAGDILGDKRNWSCQATYERTGIAIPASQMIEKIRQRSNSFAVTLPTSSTLSTTWGLSEPVKTVKLATLRDRDEIAVSVISAVQGYFPVMALKPEFKMVDLPLPEPKKQDGSAQPRPADIPPLYRGDLVIKAPLRSVDALVQSIEHVSWDAVGLQVDAFAKADQKGLTASAMQVEVTGKAIGRK